MTPAPSWRNRIVRSGDAALSEIRLSGLNWRTHPAAQQRALSGVLGSVGWVQSVIINERTGTLIDGHARVRVADDAGETSVPAVWVDLSDDEERVILATLDPLASMAETDAEQLRALLATVASEDAALSELLAELGASITPTIPTPSEQTEPVLRSACLIEIRCSAADRDDFADVLGVWGARDGVEIDIS